MCVCVGVTVCVCQQSTKRGTQQSKNETAAIAAQKHFIKKLNSEKKNPFRFIVDLSFGFFSSSPSGVKINVIFQQFNVSLGFVCGKFQFLHLLFTVFSSLPHYS